MRAVEQVRAADGRNRNARFAEQPRVNIHVVAALLQDHRACFAAVPPVAAHERVRLMPVADVFVRADRDDLADPAAVEDTFQRVVKRRVPQHVADNDFARTVPCSLDDAAALRKIGRNRLFHQNVVPFSSAGIACPTCWRSIVETTGVRELFLSEQLLGAREAAPAGIL